MQKDVCWAGVLVHPFYYLDSQMAILRLWMLLTHHGRSFSSPRWLSSDSGFCSHIMRDLSHLGTTMSCSFVGSSPTFMQNLSYYVNSLNVNRSLGWNVTSAGLAFDLTMHTLHGHKGYVGALLYDFSCKVCAKITTTLAQSLFKNCRWKLSWSTEHAQKCPWQGCWKLFL